MRKLFFLFLALVATTSLWAFDFESGDLYYTITRSSAPYTVEVSDAVYSITSIAIPETVTYNGTTYSVTSIGVHAFKFRSSLTSVTIGNSVTSIGDDAFYCCTSLTSVTIGNSVTSIGNRAFYSCRSLTSVTINSDAIVSKSYSDDSTISDIFGSQVTEYIIGDDVKKIGNNAFYDCSSLTSVTIGNSVTSIGKYAFDYCSSLTSVTIPNSVTSIGEKAFRGTGIDENESNWENNVLYIDNCLICANTSISSSYTIKENTRLIADNAFSYCRSLTSITIPNSVTSIGKGAFDYCESLTSVTINSDAIVNKTYSYSSNISDFGSQVTEYIIGDDVKGIGDYAFYSCSSLTSVTIGNSVTSIGEYAFKWCTSLTSVTIGNSVTSIGDDAFYYCSSLTSITCEATTPPTLGSNNVFYGVSTSIPVYVPCGSENIYKAASGWKEFTNIQEPQVEYAIQVSTSNSQMGTAIVDYNSCAGAHISATANIGYHFVQWSDGNTDNPRVLELTQDTILTAEFAQSFSGQCGDNLYWSYDETTKTVSIIGSGKMYDYTADTQPWLLFKNQLVEVTTSNTVTSIGTSAFEGCIRLSKISLGTGLEEIAANAFAGCTRLYDIYTYATYPPFADESSFANYNVYVYIPCEYQRDYILDVVWGKFKFIECIDSEEATTDGNVTVVPGFNDVTITWPTDSNADTYTIVIKKDGEVFCTLTFNAVGQLLNIAFAPSRDGNNRPVQYAEQAVNGFTFTITGLDEGSVYTYDLVVKDRGNNIIQFYSGEFRTWSVYDRTVRVEYDAKQGKVTGAGRYLLGETATLTAIPNEGYQFVRWEDGSTDNPRTLVIAQDTSLVAYFEIIYLQPDSVTLCYGETYQWHDKTYDASGVYVDTLSNGVATLHLTILPQVEETTEEATICAGEQYTWQADGKVYAESGIYSVTLQDINGCDSVVILHLTVNPVATTEETIIACYSYEWNNQTYTQSGEYTYTTTAANGCDSIVTLHLTINQTQYAEETVTACDQYVWNGTTYTKSGEYTYTTTTANGCDSIITLHLTINRTQYAEETITACDSFEWNGLVYTESGDYTYNTTTDQGCKRVEILHLTINNTVYTEEHITACDSYTWNGQTYATTSAYTYTTNAANGCDSIVTLHLTILPDATTESETLALCPSELPYDWYGQTLIEAGTYSATEQYAGMECDSVIHELTLNVYVQTLPARVTLPIVRTGETIDVTIPTAEIQAHIAAETWYAPNALVVWYIMENSDWAVLTTEPVKTGIKQVVVKYAVETDCGNIESNNMVTDVIPTSVENINSPSPISNCQKILYEDHIYILREGKVYSVMGQEM